MMQWDISITTIDGKIFYERIQVSSEETALIELKQKVKLWMTDGLWNTWEGKPRYYTPVSIKTIEPYSEKPF